MNSYTIPKADFVKAPSRFNLFKTGNEKAAVPLEWEDLEKCLEYCSSRGLWRDFLLFGVGSCAGLRYSEIARLTYRQLVEIQNQYSLADDERPDAFQIWQSKAKAGQKRTRTVNITPKLREIVNVFWGNIPHTRWLPEHYLFVGTRGPKSCENKSMSIQAAENRLKQVAANAGVKSVVSTHSMRKAYGMKMFSILKETEGVETALLILSKEFGHKSISATKFYLGLAEKAREIATKKFT